jgi:hypothetical protein
MRHLIYQAELLPLEPSCSVVMLRIVSVDGFIGNITVSVHLSFVDVIRGTANYRRYCEVKGLEVSEQRRIVFSHETLIYSSHLLGCS